VQQADPSSSYWARWRPLWEVVLSLSEDDDVLEGSERGLVDASLVCLAIGAEVLAVVPEEACRPATVSVLLPGFWSTADCVVPASGVD
jgi:hypothetical protein